MNRRLIGEIFPVKEVSKESAREKFIRHGHISTLHLWWARRPLASSRTTIYASLVDPPKNIEEWGKKHDLITNLAIWENSTNHDLINQVQQEILENNGGLPPKILDPFGGGGAIPLEALRLGCETYSSDINPVSILIQKCVLEFPQKFHESLKDELTVNGKQNKLLDDVKKYSDWIYNKAFEEIGQFYPQIDNMIPVGYVIARTVKCQNHKCGVEIPMMNSYWLAQKLNKKIAVYPTVHDKTIQFKIVGTGYDSMPPGFDPNKGSISGAIAVCIACGTVIDPKTLKNLFWQKKVWDKQIVTIITNKKISGKKYRLTNKEDLLSFQNAEKYLEIKRNKLMKELEIDPIPDEIIDTPNNKEYQQGGLSWRDSRCVLYGMTRWKHLFNSRQCLSLIVFLEKIKLVHKSMLNLGCDEEYAKIVTTYLAIMLDKLVVKNSNLSRYNATGEKIEHVFGRQALQMIWIYAETNPFTSVGWRNIQNWVMQVISHCSEIKNPVTKITQEPAFSLSYKDNYFDAIFTDPPYYDNIHYSLLSDFFYVWLKRSIGDLYPELFSTPLTPKSDEAIANLSLTNGDHKSNIKNNINSIKTKENFEKTLSNSFKEMCRVLKKEGIAVIVYAHKSTDGWESLINSILESGLVITGAWPISTEMKARMIAKDNAALNSSIYMIARKTKKIDLGFYRVVKKDLEIHIVKKLQYLWEQGISGTDFFISAIGASIEIFGQYKKIVDDGDNPVTIMHLLGDVRKIVTDFAINQVLQGGFGGEISQMTRFYILWRWAFGYARIPFDDALKMAQSVGLDIEHECNNSFIIKENEFIKILDPLERKIEEIESKEIIDILHKSVLLWKNNKQKEMLILLKNIKFDKIDIFYKVAQAITEINPNSPESKLLDGFLAGKGKTISKITTDPKQRKFMR